MGPDLVGSGTCGCQKQCSPRIASFASAGNRRGGVSHAEKLHIQIHDSDLSTVDVVAADISATCVKPRRAVAKSIKERLRIVVSCCTHKISNAPAEGMNSKIVSIKRRVGGLRNCTNYKAAIFFYYGGVSLDS